MADAKSTLAVRVRVWGKNQLTELERRFKSLDKAVTQYGNRLSAQLDRTDGKWRKSFDYLDKAIRGAGHVLLGFVNKAVKFAVVQFAALGAGMLAVHAAFVLGNASMKVFRGAAQLAAGAAAGLTIAVAAAAAAIREQQAAMFAYKGKGKNEFGSGLNQIRVEMRGLMTDASLAAVGTENLNAAFSTIAKSAGGFNQSSQNLFRGLMDFASAGQDIKTGSKAAADLVAALSDPKASFSKVTEAAKALGPEMTKALEEAKKKGVDTAEELKKAIVSGELATLGGVEGQFAAFNSTLINRAKSLFMELKNMFADMGQPYLEPLKKELYEVGNILRRAFLTVYGDIETFAQGNFLDKISVVTEKIANFFVKMIQEYLPKVNGMFERTGDWWARFKDGWNSVLDTLRPLIDAARVLEKMFKEILSPIGDAIGEGFTQMRDLIVANEKEFIQFGGSVGKFIESFSEFARNLREIFVEALPFLTKIVDGAKVLFDTFTSILGVFRQLTGGLGDFGPFALLGVLRSMGTGMKNARGGQIFTPKVMNVDAGTVNLRTGTALQNSLGGTGTGTGAGGGAPTNGSGGAINTKDPYLRVGPHAVPNPNYIPPGAPTAAEQQISSRSKSGVAAAGATAGGTAAAQRSKLRNFVTGLKGRYDSYATRNLMPYDVGLATLQGQIDPATGKKFTEADAKAMLATQRSTGRMPIDMYKTMSDKARQARGGKLGARIFGGEYNGKEYKGMNKSAGGMAAASLGLGLLSNAGIFGEESQGALALGSTVAMFNPMAGLAVGLGGAALTATNAASGALAGAGAGAAIGTMIAPGIGTAIGGVIGAGLGLVSGILGRDKKLKAEARKAGEKAVNTMAEGLLEGMQDNIRKAGISAMTTTGITEQFDIMERRTSEATAGLSNFLVNNTDSDEIKKFLEAQREAGNILLAGLSDADFESLLKKPKEALDKILDMEVAHNEASDLIESKYVSRMKYFSETLGKSEEEIIKLAKATGVNLFDAAADTEKMMRELAKGMITSFADIQRVAGQGLANIADIFTKPLDQMKGTLAFDEAFRTLRDQIDAGAIVGEQGRMQLLQTFQNMPANMLAMKGGDQIASAFEIARMFDPKTGTLFTQKGGPLEGQQALIESLIPGLLGKMTTEANAIIGNTISEFVSGNLLRAGFQFEGAGAEQLRAAASTGQLSETEYNSMVKFITENDMSNRENQDRLTQMIKGSTDLNLKITQSVAPLEAAAIKLEDVADNQMLAAQLIIQKLGQGDTTSRRAIGDTTSNLGNTLGKHDRLNSSIPGKRTITSSYRNFALGSLNSDHLTGNALDLVGDNLVSYRDKTRSSGGFAEFHGGLGGRRHLHVVPSMGRIGDSTAQPMQTSASSTSSESITINNSFTISGAEGSKEDLAKYIISQINASIRDARERS